MVVEYLQFDKEQIELVSSPDTEIPIKRAPAALLSQVGIRFKACAGKGKAKLLPFFPWHSTAGML